MPFELSGSRHLLGRSCPKPSWQKLKIFAVLPTAREMKKFIFHPERLVRLCRKLSASTIARIWGTAIPIKFVGVSKPQNELLAAKAKLALCFPPISLQQQNKKIIRVTISSKVATRIFLCLQFVNIL
jgi:hypothetical protein